MVLWFPLMINCTVDREDYEDESEYVATIPDVDYLEGVGGTAREAVKDLSEKAFYQLRMG